MRIAFYAPLKAPDHPVPSGDRQMARLLVEALEKCGHEVELVSSLRAFGAVPDKAHYDALSKQTDDEIKKIRLSWQRAGAPDLWFTYHPYYKAPDLLGPQLARDAGIPYVTAEASYSERRNDGAWKETQGLVIDAVRQAAANLCFTQRDRRGLESVVPSARLVDFPPFIRPVATTRQQNPGFPRLITIAMMRSGDKLESYRMLGAALKLLTYHQWSLMIVGGGSAEPQVRQAFEGIETERLQWIGQVPPEKVPALLSNADIYVWPGFGEAYGLAYLEAGAAGLPVVAQRVAGVPEAVRDGQTGLLTPVGDVGAFAAAIGQLLKDADLRKQMGERGRAFVHSERSLEAATQRLDAILTEIVRG